MIGIIGAMDIEVDAIKQRLEGKKEITKSGMVFCSGLLNGKEAVVAKCEPGKVNAASCAAIMITLFDPDIVINTGIGGSMNKDIHTNSIVIADKLVQHDFDLSDLEDVPVGYIPGACKVYFDINKNVINTLTKACEIHNIKDHFVGTIATGDQFIGSKDKKQIIQDRFTPLSVDMESAAIAHICHLSGIECGIIRSISDNASDDAKDEYFFNFEEVANLSANICMTFVKLYNDGGV